LRLIVAVIVAIVRHIAAHSAARLLLLKIGLVLTKLFLRGGDQAKIMFGVLIVIFGGDWISGALRIAGELEIFFGNVRGRAPDFYVLAVGLIHPRQRILVMMTALTITTAHAFILTVSHGLLFRQPCFARRQRRRRLCSPSLVTERHSNSIAPAASRPLSRLNVTALSQSALIRGFVRGIANLLSCARLAASMRAEPLIRFGLTFTV
jgi:hypothetical protein